MNNPPQARVLSLAFRLIVGGVLFVGAAIFFLALHHPQKDLALADIKGTREGWWMHEQAPTPKPTPRVMPTPTSRPIVIQAVPTPAPHAQPTICQICLERQMRYQKAIETGMGTDTGRVRELPQLLTPAAQPSPDIFAWQQP